MFLDIKDLKDKEIYLKLNKTSDANIEKQFVSAYHFDICLLDDTTIGKCDLRVGHNNNTYIGGNIGYGIDEKYRGHHYAAKACKLLFKLARKHNMEYLIITCDPSNIASSKTCEMLKGKYIEIIDIPKDNEMYALG